jgi:hypothetical protein
MMPNGRRDESTGAVYVANKKGDDLCNTYMRGETKAKRRVTLSICGLGILDESELDTLPRIATSATISHAPTLEEDAELRLTIMAGIDDTLKRTINWDDADDRERGKSLIRDAFGTTYKGLAKLTVPQLQAGYAHLQELLVPSMPDDDDDVPDFSADEPTTVMDGEVEPSPTSPDALATTAQLGHLKRVARDLGDETLREIEALISDHDGHVAHKVYALKLKQLMEQKIAQPAATPAQEPSTEHPLLEG